MYKAILDYLKKHRHLRSLRLFIFLAIFICSIVLCFVLSGTSVSVSEKNAGDNRCAELRDTLEKLAGNLVLYDYMTTEDSDIINLEISDISSAYNSRILIINCGYRVICDTSGILKDKYVIASDVQQCFENGTYEVDPGDDNMRIVYQPIYDGQTVSGSGKIVGVIKASVDISDIHKQMIGLYGKLWLRNAIVIVGVSVFSFLVATLITRPFVHLSRTVERVASFEEGDINVMGYQETEGIIKAFNAQRKRLKTLDESRQEFVSDVSHELKTPIASMKVLADSLLLQEDAPIEMYKDFMQDIVEEVDRENKIISDLLELVHMDKGKEGLKIARVDVNAMLELIIKRLTPIAAQNDVEITFKKAKNVVAEIDEVKMTLALTNLVENAIKYNKRGGWVKIILEVDHQFMYIEISDSGLGIPEDSISHIYERFYRADKSHSKAIGGTGLGLPITRKIVLLHRGSINVSSEVGNGTTFELRIPINYVK